MFNQPTAAWRDEAGSISFTLTYGAAELAQLPEETKVSLPLTLTSSGSQLIEGSQPHSMTIRMRTDGALRAIIPVPRELQSSVISRLKIMARMDIAQKLIPQDGRANVTVRQESLDLRISTLPTIHG